MSTQQSNQKKVIPVERKVFQFHEFQEEDVSKTVEVVVAEPTKKTTGPWSDDLIEDKDDPSWTTVKRRIRKTK